MPRYLVMVVVIYLVGAYVPLAYLLIVQGLLNMGGQILGLPGGGGTEDAAYAALLSPYLSAQPLAFSLLVWRTYNFYWCLILGAPIFLIYDRAGGPGPLPPQKVRPRMVPQASPDPSQNQAPPPDEASTGADLAALMGTPPDMPDREEYLFFFAATVLVVMVISSFVGILIVEPIRQSLYEGLFHSGKLVAVMHACGVCAPLLFILLVAAQVMLMMWPMPFKMAAGVLFGVPLGLLYSLLGLALGSALAFLAGRWLGNRVLSRAVKPATMKIVRRVMRREGALAAFLIFLIPGLPKDIICYVFGMTRISLGFFLVATTLARLPGVLLATLQGSQMFQGRYGVTWGLLALYVGLALLLYWRRQAVYQWLRRFHPGED